jgi:hypothetical protein
MNRWLTLLLMGLAGLLANCGTSVSSSTQPGTHDEFSVVVTPDQFTLNAGDWSSISATVDLSNQNSAPKPISPQPTLKFSSSDTRVTVSPSGEVCAGQWDSRHLTCAPTVIPPQTCTVVNTVTTCTPNPNAGQLDLPTGYVTITAFDASHGVGSSTIVSVHPRATGITLTAPVFAGVVAVVNGVSTIPPGQYPQATGCVSQNQQVKYLATPVFGANASGTVNPPFDNDYTWSVGDANVASVSTHGAVIARNPGVTNVYAKLNGTVSVPLAFATCPPASMVLASSAFTKGVPVPPFSTADLDNLAKGTQTYLTVTTVVDTNGNALQPLDSNGAPLITLPITYVSSDLLIGTFTHPLPLTADFTANTSGRTTVMAACEPSTCNASVADFISPAGPETAKSGGFGFPIYSNVIGVTVTGTTGSTVLVTGTTFADGTTPIFRLLVYDSESLTITHTVELANTPNSLVVAPNGLKAYVGSSKGLIVVDLTSYQSSLQTFPVQGGLSTDVVTGTVLRVSPDSRYVLISDTSDPNPVNNLVFFIDTTGTKLAARYAIPDAIRAVTFAADNSNFWVAGDKGVYVFNSDTFVKTLTNVSTNVTALAWTPDGQSYFASGQQLVNYSTCEDQNPQLPSIPTGSPLNLSTTVIGGVPHVIGLSSGNQWLDYSVTSSSQIAPSGQAIGSGYVCSSAVTVGTPATAPSDFQCTAQQISFSPRLEQEFITGVDSSCAPDPVIHGYDVSTHAEIIPPLTATSPIVPLSGGLLSDGRELYIGTWDSTAKTAALHRFNLLTTTGTQGTLTEDIAPVSVELVPSFVAVVPK